MNYITSSCSQSFLVSFESEVSSMIIVVDAEVADRKSSDSYLIVE
jgi:hypothetical protein